MMPDPEGWPPSSRAAILAGIALALAIWVGARYLLQ
jgi:hypothetical protein